MSRERHGFIDHLTIDVRDLAANRYHAGHYAAFVLDPDGHNVEAVFHGRG